MKRELATTMLLFGMMLGLAACASSTDSSPTPAVIEGTYHVTAIDCDAVALTTTEAISVGRIISGRSWVWTFDDGGLGLTIEIIDPACTWAARYSGAVYHLPAVFDASGIGTYTCSPSAAACIETIAATNDDHDLCGVANLERVTVAYSAPPRAAGGTMALTWPGDTWCSTHGHRDPFTLTLTRQ